MKSGQRCENYNHGRVNAPVRFCPTCGEVVNKDRRIKTCTQDEPATKRRERNKFCVHCGEQLNKGTI